MEKQAEVNVSLFTIEKYVDARLILNQLSSNKFRESNKGVKIDIWRVQAKINWIWMSFSNEF